MFLMCLLFLITLVDTKDKCKMCGSTNDGMNSSTSNCVMVIIAKMQMYCNLLASPNFISKASYFKMKTIFSGEEQNFQKNLFWVPKFSVNIQFPWNKFIQTEISVTAPLYHAPPSITHLTIKFTQKANRNTLHNYTIITLCLC